MITQVTIKYFKAIVQCNDLALKPFSVFIGNNGSGKSSVLEAMQALQIAIADDLQKAFSSWNGLDKIRNYMAVNDETEISDYGFRRIQQPITIAVKCHFAEKNYEYEVAVNLNETGDYYVVERELLVCEEPKLDGSIKTTLIDAEVVSNNGRNFCRVFYSATGPTDFTYEGNRLLLQYTPGINAINGLEVATFRNYLLNWQFLSLNPHDMGKPLQQTRLNRRIRLAYDGRNIAEYIVALREHYLGDYEALIRKLEFVLPYLSNIVPQITDTTAREVHLLAYEQHEKSRPLPGWLLSSGTLRILAILALLSAADTISVLFIDEVENGLDPRTIGLLLSEIERVFHKQSMQVVVTTHSPYFLDQVPLESIIVAEKEEEGTVYHLPSTDESLKMWKDKFAPGKLYTMGKLTK